MDREDFDFDNYTPDDHYGRTRNERAGGSRNDNPGRTSRDYSDGSRSRNYQSQGRNREYYGEDTSRDYQSQGRNRDYPDENTDRYFKAYNEDQIPRVEKGTQTRKPLTQEQIRARKMRKRRKAMRKRILVAVLIIILLGAAAAGIVFGVKYLLNNSSSSSDAAGTVLGAGEGTNYTREVDITQETAANIALWLSDVEKMDIDLSWVLERCPQFKIKSILTLNKDGFNKGTYSESIDETSYNELSASMDTCMNSMLNEIIAERLTEAGYADSVTAEEAAAITSSVLGTDAASYIKENNVNLLPGLDELTAEYVMGSGSYEISKGVITFKDESDGAEISDTLIKKKDSLVLVDSDKVYVMEAGE